MAGFVVVFTRSQDEHSDRLAGALDALGVRCIRVHRNKILNYSFEFNHDALVLTTPEGRVNASEALGVFVRTIPAPQDFGPLSEGEFASLDQYVALQRSNLFTDWFAALAMRVPVMNTPAATSQIMGKGAQQVVARKVGLDCPDTYIGENPTDAEAFAVAHLGFGREVCTKPIANKTVVIEGEKFTRFTEKLPPDGVKELRTLQGCPIIIQPYVAKAYELRVTVVGEVILACKIDSQEAGGPTAVDWRRYNVPRTPHDAYTLPPDIADRLLAFHRVAGLRYSAFDLIRDTEGRYNFLETNPFGQWLWIEDLTGLPIARSIAACLAGKR